MSKRTTPANKTTSDAPAPRRRAAKPAADVAPVAAPVTAPKAQGTRRKTPSEVTSSAEVGPATDARQPSHDEIAIRAYFISIERGADPVAAWLLAERELTTA